MRSLTLSGGLVARRTRHALRLLASVTVALLALVIAGAFAWIGWSSATAGVAPGAASARNPYMAGTPEATPTCPPGGGPYQIAIVFSDDDPPGKLINYIIAEPDVASVTSISARFSTPPLSDLLLYDEVVLFSNIEYDDPVAMGNVIADYQDAGGVVVATNANWYGPPYGLEGRWMTGGYTMFNYPAPTNNSTSTLGAYEPTAPLMQDVITLTAFFRNQMTLTVGATQVAAWADEWPLVAHKTNNGHTAVGINAYLGFPEEGWDGDFGTLIVNAARWLKPAVPCGMTATVTPTAQATSTPTDTVVATQTATQIPITATPTACLIEFTDVPEGSTFYDFVRCMACNGIINGYTSGCETGNPCFRPNTNVTRGQLSKIVANAAGFNEPVGAQQYEDVPIGSTFFDFVWRLANRGYVSGYLCGGPGEPCNPPGNLAYFRPNGDATRGQISKIVSNAAGFIDPPGNRIFEDVAPGSTFYDFVQRLASRMVMSGYLCGGPGEPCVAPDNLPYFRPQSNATRGQTSKIVANTFFPGCSPPVRK